MRRVFVVAVLLTGVALAQGSSYQTKSVLNKIYETAGGVYMTNGDPVGIVSIWGADKIRQAMAGLYGYGNGTQILTVAIQGTDGWTDVYELTGKSLEYSATIAGKFIVPSNGDSNTAYDFNIAGFETVYSRTSPGSGAQQSVGTRSSAPSVRQPSSGFGLPNTDAAHTFVRDLANHISLVKVTCPDKTIASAKPADVECYQYSYNDFSLFKQEVDNAVNYHTSVAPDEMNPWQKQSRPANTYSRLYYFASISTFVDIVFTDYTAFNTLVIYSH